MHVIIEAYGNKVLSWELSQTRNSHKTIQLVLKTIKVLGYEPRIFHSDHGVEYTNYKFKNFLSQRNILQSMSSKGRSLGNRPSEYFFAQVQREKLNFCNISNWNYNQVYNLINSYMNWYNLNRVQSNLQYKTPQDVFASYGVCV